MTQQNGNEWTGLAQVRAARADPAPTAEGLSGLLVSTQKTSGSLSADIRWKMGEIARMKAAMYGRRVSHKYPQTFDLTWRGQWVPSQFPALHRHQAADCADWPDWEKVTRCAEVLDRHGILALVGPRGTGKTQLAHMLAEAFKERTCYFRADELFNWLKAWFTLSSADAGHNRRNLFDVPLLVIDEAQERLGTEYEDTSLTGIVDKRYGNQLPTIMISNLTPEMFAKNVGPSILSRITEQGRIVEINWPSFRGAK